MELKLKKYNSIENSDRDDFIKSIIEQGFGDLEYIVQEKVHGANLGFLTDGMTIRAAKRTEFIEDGEQFYNANILLENYHDKIIDLFNDILADNKITTITIFGEAFGGGYPHADVPIDENATLVQRGVYYCPQNEFYAFDVLLDGENYLDTSLCSDLLRKHGFIAAKTLFRGSLADCLKYRNEFRSTIPAYFNLPELDGNICEGVVIKLVHTVFLRSGSRVIIKNKNEKWSENNKFIDKELLKNIIRENSELSDEANFLCEEIYKLINENRLNNLISKIGEINPEKDFGKLLGMFNKDVLIDFMKNFNDKYEALEKQEIKAINKFLNGQSGKLIQDYFNN